MFNNKVTIVFLSALLVFDIVDGKKVKRKRITAEEEGATFPQPNVLTYSNFGFNDVGSYDGFIPSSPDYATYLSSNGGKEESTTRLYGPAFPTAMDSSDFSTGFGSHLPDTQSISTGSDGQQLGLFHIEPNTMNTFSFTNINSDENKYGGVDSNNGQRIEKSRTPIYGAKIITKNKAKPYDGYNDVGVKAFTTDPPTTFSNEKTNEKYYKSKKRYHSNNSKPVTSEPSGHHNVVKNGPQYPVASVENFMKTPTSNISNLLNFPRVIDFTNINKQFYSEDLEGNYPANMKPLSNSNTATSTSYDTRYENSYNNNGDKFFKVSSSTKNSFDNEEKDDKKVAKYYPISNENGFLNYSNNKYKGTVTNVEYREKWKAKPVKITNNDISPATDNDVAVSSSKFVSSNDDYNSSKNSMKGYQYSTNHSNTSFKYDFEEPKKQSNSNVDEIIPASSNIGLLDYQFPSVDYTNFNKINNLKTQFGDESEFTNTREQIKPAEDYLNRFKIFYDTTPSSTSSWGNIFKSTEYSFDKNHKRRPQFDDENHNDDVVHIPHRPSSPKYGKYDVKSVDHDTDLPFHNNYRPYKPQRPPYDWNKEITSTRFKPEEDLLGLRTRDTLRPSYLSAFDTTPSEIPDENNYKKLIEKWRIDYIKSKQKDAFHDYESYASNVKPVHEPVPKPYPIEVPHPVIIPVPQPYPVRVPVPRPIAVPVVQELMVPIEKPVPYPVFKKVPYPIEKPVPVHVEKQVPVPVAKPYPVPIPQIRPVFHHTKHRDEFNNLDHDEDSDHVPRPESSKRVPYSKRPKNSRNRPRRPSRTAFSEHSRRRWPQHQTETKDRRYSKRPQHSSMDSSYTRYRPRDREYEDNENEDREYLAYCKRTGYC